MEGDAISLDGISGEVYEREVEATFEKPVELQYFTNWIRKSSIPITISNI